MAMGYKNSLVMLAFCGAFTDFLTVDYNRVIYPRDRIIHLIFSFFIWYLVACIISNIHAKNKSFYILALFAIGVRTIRLMRRFSQYLIIFYGENAIGITLFTIIVFYMFLNIKKENFSQIYIFYLLMNILLLILLFILSADKINTSNIYLTKLTTELEFSKLFVFADVVTLALLLENKKDCLFAVKRYLLISLMVFIATTVLQGLCAGGDLLYSLSPLQTLVQIFSGETVKRFDFIMTIIFAINYFGAVILCFWAVKTIVGEKIIEKN